MPGALFSSHDDTRLVRKKGKLKAGEGDRDRSSYLDNATHAGGHFDEYLLETVPSWYKAVTKQYTVKGIDPMLFSDDERAAVYKAIYSRRDVRGQFKPDLVPDDVLSRILSAAHHAPSVGFMQPWDFVVVKSPVVKRKVKEGFEVANKEAALMFEGEKREVYQSLKLEGITEAPIGICVTCDRTRTGPVVIGRTANREMDLYSSVCAVQNLWLAARAENLGVGWVSIIHHKAVRKALNLPDHIVPIAYLCIGYVTFFHDSPELEQAGWLPRLDIESLIHYDQWGKQR